MADQSVTDGISEVGKLAGSAGGGSILTLLLSRLFGNNDKVLGRLDGIQASINTLVKDFAVQSDRSAQDRHDIETLKEEVKKLRDDVTTLKTKLEHIAEGGVIG